MAVQLTPALIVSLRFIYLIVMSQQAKVQCGKVGPAGRCTQLVAPPGRAAHQSSARCYGNKVAAVAPRPPQTLAVRGGAGGRGRGGPNRGRGGRGGGNVGGRAPAARAVSTPQAGGSAGFEELKIETPPIQIGLTTALKVSQMELTYLRLRNLIGTERLDQFGRIELHSVEVAVVGDMLAVSKDVACVVGCWAGANMRAPPTEGFFSAPGVKRLVPKFAQTVRSSHVVPVGGMYRTVGPQLVYPTTIALGVQSAALASNVAIGVVANVHMVLNFRMFQRRYLPVGGKVVENFFQIDEPVEE